eukprot:CAMPEP_0172645626 /NCGR_PEP_ID=MMETSP1068-20121228/239827_1 /TAXON_ID=35684 /ORGANISM="Pseudopedinella elastica, Strain CCMP716" /LENGTH=144 /DNA_ID=CAMNT_0013459867 /DNA_START=695 /DNA_END=1126 /DNA_ORIENTATION=+
MTYKRVPIFDNRGEDLLGHMESAISFIRQAKHYGNILVHCNLGRSRSGSFIIGYMMREHGMGYDEALALARTKRPTIAPNDAFERDLRAHGKRLEEERDAKAKMERKGYGAAKSSAKSNAKSAPRGAAAPPSIGPAMPPSSIGP